MDGRQGTARRRGTRTVKIRKAVAQDVEKIIEVHVASWQENYSGVLDRKFLRNTLPAKMRERWNQANIGIPNIVMVAEADDIIGFGAAWDGESMYLDNLHVRQGMRSAGTGRALMAGIGRAALEMNRRALHLHVIVANLRARALYERLGGKVTSRDPLDLFGTEVDAWRIEWPDVRTLIAAASVS